MCNFVSYFVCVILCIFVFLCDILLPSGVISDEYSNGPLTSSAQSVYISTINNQTRSCDQSFFVLIGQNRLQLMSVMIIHKYVNIHTSVVGPQ